MRRTFFAGIVVVGAALSSCAESDSDDATAGSDSSAVAEPEATDATPPSADSAGNEPVDTGLTDTGPADTEASTTTVTTLVPNERVGMPPVLDVDDAYAATRVGMLSPATESSRSLVYVPANEAGTVTVIDQETFEVIDSYLVGDIAQHVTPSWDLEVLYANASGWNQLVPIDPATGAAGDPIPVDAPYNLYFTPDGGQAVVMAERRNRIDYYDPDTWLRKFSIPTPCDGPNHADWSLDGQDYWVTCEFSSQLLHVSTDGALLGVVDIPGGKPQDIRLVPDGSAYYLADMNNQRVLVLNPNTGETMQEIAVGDNPHGIYPSRDGTVFYVSNRVSGTVSVIDWRTHTVVDTWVVPGGGSPDMGGVNADGTVLWLSGRFHDEVYAFDTATGELLARVPVEGGPHGLAVWPQPGRFSLGHTGNLR